MQSPYPKCKRIYAQYSLSRAAGGALHQPQKLGGVVEADPSIQLLPQLQGQQSLKSFLLAAPGGIASEEDVLEGMCTEKAAGPFRPDEGKGVGDLHVDRLAEQVFLHAIPILPAADVGGDQFQFGKGADYLHDLRCVGNPIVGIAQIEAGMRQEDQPVLLHPFIKGEHAGLVEEEPLVVGVQLDPFQTGCLDPVDLLHRPRIIRVDRGEGKKARGGNARAPAEDRFELTRLGSDGEHHRRFDAQAIHLGDQGGDLAVEGGLDFGKGAELGYGLLGQGIGKGVGVKIDDAHWVLCIAEKTSKDQGRPAVSIFDLCQTDVVDQ